MEQAGQLKIGIVGATGAVGAVALGILAERGHPAENIVAMASSRSAGKTIEYPGGGLKVQETRPELFGAVDVVFISASGEVSAAMAPEAVERGALVIDDSSHFRMEPEVPLVVPEVNGQDVEWHKGIISIPNCSATPLVMALKPLMPLAKLERMRVATYQSVSGAGSMAQQEMWDQARTLQEGGSAKADKHPHQIAFNVIPHIDEFLESGYTKEERKTEDETRKILHRPDLAISSTCVRVPVAVGHSAAVHLEFDRAVQPEEARQALEAFSGVKVVDEPGRNRYPMPISAAGEDDVLVGRLRPDTAHPNGLVMWVSSDNLRKGAALNSIQIMDEALRRNSVRSKAQPRQ